MFFIYNKNYSTKARLSGLKKRISNKKNTAAKFFDHITADNNTETKLKEQLMLIRDILQKQQKDSH